MIVVRRTGMTDLSRKHSEDTRLLLLQLTRFIRYGNTLIDNSMEAIAVTPDLTRH
jgi:hypothetical protein